MKEKEFPTNSKNLTLLNGEDSEEVKKLIRKKASRRNSLASQKKRNTTLKETEKNSFSPKVKR